MNLKEVTVFLVERCSYRSNSDSGSWGGSSVCVASACGGKLIKLFEMMARLNSGNGVVSGAVFVAEVDHATTAADFASCVHVPSEHPAIEIRLISGSYNTMIRRIESTIDAPEPAETAPAF